MLRGPELPMEKASWEIPRKGFLPKGPARALFLHLTVQTLPADATHGCQHDAIPTSGAALLTSGACKRIGHIHEDIEVLCLGLGETVDTGNVVLDSEVLSDDTVVTGFDLNDV